MEFKEGTRFVNMIVLYKDVEKSERLKKPHWFCRCSCGNIVSVLKYNLIHRPTQSCIECRGKKVGKKVSKDLSGQKLGRLLILKKVEGINNKYHCVCDCGVEVVKSYISLIFYKCRSCGCLRRERIPQISDPIFRWAIKKAREEGLVFNSATWAKEIKKKGKRKCKICGSKKNLCAHHLYNKNDFPELRFDLNNGVVLCKDCHENYHRIFGKEDNTKEQFGDHLQTLFFLERHT